MSKGTVRLLIGLGITFFLALVVYGKVKGSYNMLVRLDEEVNAAWAQVENQLQRRFDLVPNLVNTVKGYAAHEKEVLTAITNARSRVGSARTVEEKIKSNNELSSTLSRLLVVMENYPNLKADQNFLNLQAQLEGTENRIAVERRRYNEKARTFNALRRSFPTNIFANLFGFSGKSYFEADKDAQKAPEVQF